MDSVLSVVSYIAEPSREPERPPPRNVTTESLGGRPVTAVVRFSGALLTLPRGVITTDGTDDTDHTWEPKSPLRGLPSVISVVGFSGAPLTLPRES